MRPRVTSNLFIRIKDNANTSDALAQIESVIKKDNPGYPFEYRFVDAEFDKLFKSEMLVAKLSRLFAILTIFISCLGLFGFAAYTAERRTKEIGIRKVLGATVANMVSLLSKDFLKLVSIAVIVASPVAWYIMNNWLQDYAYRINIQWWIFVMAAIPCITHCILNSKHSGNQSCNCKSCKFFTNRIIYYSKNKSSCYTICSLTALRNLRRNKFFSMLNILGLGNWYGCFPADCTVCEI